MGKLPIFWGNYPFKKGDFTPPPPPITANHISVSALRLINPLSAITPVNRTNDTSQSGGK